MVMVSRHLCHLRMITPLSLFRHLHSLCILYLFIKTYVHPKPSETDIICVCLFLYASVSGFKCVCESQTSNLYAPSHRQDSTYHGLCYTSRGSLAGTRNSSMGPPWNSVFVRVRQKDSINTTPLHLPLLRDWLSSGVNTWQIKARSVQDRSSFFLIKNISKQGRKYFMFITINKNMLSVLLNNILRNEMCF